MIKNYFKNSKKIARITIIGKLEGLKISKEKNSDFIIGEQDIILKIPEVKSGEELEYKFFANIDEGLKNNTIIVPDIEIRYADVRTINLREIKRVAINALNDPLKYAEFLGLQ